MVIIRIPFKLQRIKNTYMYLNKSMYILPAMGISFVVIFLAMQLNSEYYSFYYVFLNIMGMLFAVIIIVNWKNTITHSYLEQISIRDFDIMNANLSKAKLRIDELSADNERMGHILHRDKKLVSAMENDVESFVKEVLDYVDDPSFRERLSEKQLKDISGFREHGNKILDDLHEMAKGREGMIIKQERSVEKLPKTNVSSVDRLFKYMQDKAYDSDISFHVTVAKDIKDIGELFEKTISDEDFCTLLADLIDNAIIATKYNNGKQVMVNISRVSDDKANIFDKLKYNPKDIAVHIFDSGIPFTKEVLVKYGLEKITTHADDKGNGLGLMKTYDTLSKCGASLFIHEFDTDSGFYTKEITVVFNRKHQYLIYTNRDDSDISYIRKRADVTIVKR